MTPEPHTAAHAPAGGETSAPEPPGARRLRQARAACALELRRGLLSRRALVYWGLALAPAALLVLVSFLQPRPLPARDVPVVFANGYQGLLLRCVIFFGAAALFTGLFRADLTDRSLHYWFLSPIRREALAVARFAAGLTAALVLFGGCTLLAWIACHLLAGPAAAGALLAPEAARQLGAYLAVTALACLGYGAVFTWFGIAFRNPTVPVLLVWGWEWINFLLPPGLKALSVIHYLNSLLPLRVSEGPFALLAEPVSGLEAALGLLALAVAFVALSARRARRMEIAYGAE